MSPANPRRTALDQVWNKLVVSLELADLTDPATRARLDSAAAKANNQGLQTAAAWRYARALPMLTAAVEIWSRLEQPGEVHARNVRGGVYRKLGQFAAAVDDHQAALDAAQRHHLDRADIAARWGLGAALAERGDLDSAEQTLDGALRLSTAAQDAWGTGHAWRWRGEVHEIRKHWDAARAAYQSAHEAFGAVAAPVEQIEALAGSARAALASGHTLDAYALAEQVLRHLGERGPARLDEPLRVYWTVYRVLHLMQQPDEARAMLDLAHQMMLQQADDLSGADRARFLNDLPTQRAIGDAWAALSGE